MTNGTVVQVPARHVGEAMPSTLAVGPAVIELTSERTANGGSHSRRFAARWSKGPAEGTAYIEIEPAAKTATRLTVTIEPPSGVQRALWPTPARRRLGNLFAQALGYEVETRNVEETDAFEVRRTTPELVKARTA